VQLDSQALAAFGAACVDHSTAAFGFHAHEKAMGTGAASFGRLISTFHDSIILSKGRWATVLIESSVLFKLRQAKPSIIADFKAFVLALGDAFLVLTRVWRRY
jgi:hypothetical protein